MGEEARMDDISASNPLQPPPPPPPVEAPVWKVIVVAAIAAGIQFGWALQLSLLTPYVQLLGIPHTWAAYIWLCGPISGLIVQPIVGYYSDHCTSRFGRRRPFIAVGAIFVAVAVFLIGYAADIGHKSGDPSGKTIKIRAIVIFIVGFTTLDVANNMLQGPCRAFLADLSGSNSQKTRNANALFSFFMALGNVLGYAAGSSTKLYKIFPFTMTHACDVYCANLKSCFFLSIALLGILTILALSTVHENVFVPENEGHDKEGKFGTLFWREMFGTFKGLPKPMWILILVTALNWIGWFPFLLYDTDWMGREIYGGTVGEGKMYDLGVRAGAMGLMINAGVLGVTSLAVVFLVRGVHSVKRLWGAANLLLAFCMVMTIMVSKFAESNRRFATTADGETTPLPPLTVIKAAALTIFAMLGIPLAVTFSVPFALASIFASKYGGAGQGLSLGVLNLAIVIPQMIVSVSSGPLDARFGGGNLPAFVVGAVAAAASGIVAFTMLPSLRSETTASDPVK